MKKVKIMLLGITIMGITGGSLAFKAKKNPAFCWYTSTTLAIGNCPLVEPKVLNGILTYYYTRNTLTEECPEFSTCTITAHLTCEQ